MYSGHHHNDAKLFPDLTRTKRSLVHIHVLGAGFKLKFTDARLSPTLQCVDRLQDRAQRCPRRARSCSTLPKALGVPDRFAKWAWKIGSIMILSWAGAKLQESQTSSVRGD